MNLHERRRTAAEWLAGLAAVDLETAHDRFDTLPLPDWVAGILLVAVPSQALAVWRVHADLPAGSRPPLLDSVIFEYIGWYLTRGGRLYVDVWEIKPPIPYEVTAVVSLIAGGDPLLGHALNVGLTAGAAVGTALVAGAVVSDLTGDGVAAFAAGVSLYVLPAYHWRAAFGFKVKYFVAFLALLAVFLARRDRPVRAGVAAGAAAGFWQLAVVVPVLAAGIAHRRGGRRATARTLAGVAGVVVVGVLPVLYWGAAEAMVTETVLTPLLVAGVLGSADPLTLAAFVLGGALPVAALGAVGVAVGLWQRPHETWWLAAGTAWFALQAYLVDFDASPDLFPMMAFFAVGVGLLLGLEAGRQRPAAALIAIMAVVSVVTMGGFGITGPAVYAPGPLEYRPGLEPTLPYSTVDEAHLYWNGVPAETCRVFYGRTQHALVGLIDGSSVQPTCGDAGPVVDALLERWAV